MLKYLTSVIFLQCLLNQIVMTVLQERLNQQYKLCRLTKIGTEYIGTISETKNGHICDFWSSNSVTYLNENITDNDFPDGSKKLAKNYCRNPNNSEKGIWCFTGDGSQKELCSIPVCNSGENCRHSGTAIDYSGSFHKTVNDNECLHWAAVTKIGNLDAMFPEGNTILAGKSCRNPTDSIEGPWCYVLTGDVLNEEEIKVTESCNVPMCFNLQSVTVIRSPLIVNQQQYYTHFSTLNSKTESISFSIKLWNPNEWNNGEIRVGLSTLAIPVNGHQLREWDIGFEVILRNVKGGITSNDKEDETWEDHPGLITGIEWVHLKISRSGGFISLTRQGHTDPYYTYEYKEQQHGILTEEKAILRYISIVGTTVFWNSTLSADGTCEEHITSSIKITRYWSMSTISVNKFLDFHLRSLGECILELRVSPTQDYPRAECKIQETIGKVKIIIWNNAKKEPQVLSETSLTEPLTFWKWATFSISISGSKLNMVVKTAKGENTLFDVNDPTFQAVSWYGIGSITIAYWSLQCKPAVEEYEAIPPECIVSKLGNDYVGHQWFTKSGHACIPWTVNKERLQSSQFPESNIAEALNYCRNPTKDEHGAYCYAIRLEDVYTITKEACSLRTCKFKDCRIAGTANDFMGQLSTTISGKECQAWLSNKPHTVDRHLLNDYLFPERSVIKAKNYCRNPSANMAGPWCYTNDLVLQEDLCNVPDCNKQTQCTIIVRTLTKRRVYLDPESRTFGLPIWIKQWNPNITTTLILTFYPNKKKYQYRLTLGDEDNETLKFYYINDAGNEELLKQKTISHFLASGRWIGISIEFQNDELKISYEDKLDNPFFVWRLGSMENYPVLKPTFFSYEAKSEHDDGPIGLSFPCDHCQTEICSKEKMHYSVLYPINLWMENVSLPVNNVTFNLRGTGSFTIYLHTVPSKTPPGVIYLNGGRNSDQIEVQMVRRRFLERIVMNYTKTPVVVKKHWTQFVLTMNNKEGSLILNETNYYNWTYPKASVFYYFSIECSNEITWIVNCEPPLLDGTPIDGKWSEWSKWECSVTCGGGQGKRFRYCNNPKPSMFGRTCLGAKVQYGVCNEIKCGDITLGSIRVIRASLAASAKNIKVKIFERVDIACNGTLLKMMKHEAPKTTLQWAKNGLRISQNVLIEEVDTEHFEISIQSATISDSGVYTCFGISQEKEYEVIDVIALIVTTQEYTTQVRIDHKFYLKANSAVLNTIYTNLRLTWYVDDKIYKEYDITDLRLIDEEIINPVTWEHNGIWTSVIYQDQLGLNWTTSWYNVLVRKKANWATYLLEEDLLKGKLGKNEIVIYVVVLVLFFIAISCATAFVIFIIRLQKYFKHRIKQPNK